jgi:hypothetical protein
MADDLRSFLKALEQRGKVRIINDYPWNQHHSENKREVFFGFFFLTGFWCCDNKCKQGQKPRFII